MVKPKVAIVVPDYSAGGGVPAVASFLLKALLASNNYHAEVFSLATSARDQDSFRILAPRTWIRRPRLSVRNVNGVDFRHFGAFGSEVEIFRYLPRSILTKEL